MVKFLHNIDFALELLGIHQLALLYDLDGSLLLGLTMDAL
jgi:hypothetical protein